MIKLDYYVLDQYDDAWNSEPFTTFKNAWDFKNFLQPFINKPVILRVESVPRGATWIYRIQ